VCVCVCVCVIFGLQTFFLSILMYLCVHTSGKQHWVRKICRQETVCLLNKLWTNTNTPSWSDRHRYSLTFMLRAFLMHIIQKWHKFTKRFRLNIQRLHIGASGLLKSILRDIWMNRTTGKVYFGQLHYKCIIYTWNFQ